MNSGCKLNIVVTCILVISFASMAKAQLASNKSLDEIYNKKVQEQLAEKNKRGKLFNPLQKEKNIPASRYSLRDVAKVAIKNPGIIPHNNSAQSEEDKKSSLPGNSSTLKQSGMRGNRSLKPPLH